MAPLPVDRGGRHATSAVASSTAGSPGTEEVRRWKMLGPWRRDCGARWEGRVPSRGRSRSGPIPSYPHRLRRVVARTWTFRRVAGRAGMARYHDSWVVADRREGLCSPGQDILRERRPFQWLVAEQHASHKVQTDWPWGRDSGTPRPRRLPPEPTSASSAISHHDHTVRLLSRDCAEIVAVGRRVSTKADSGSILGKFADSFVESGIGRDFGFDAVIVRVWFWPRRPSAATTLTV